MSLDEASEYLRKSLFDECRDHVSIEAMAITHAEHPQARHLGEIPDANERVLVRLRMPWHEPLPLLDAENLNHISLDDCHFAL